MSKKGTVFLSTLLLDPLEHLVPATGVDAFVRLFRGVVVDMVHGLVRHGDGDGAIKLT